MRTGSYGVDYDVDSLIKEVLNKSDIVVGSAAVIRACQRRKLGLVLLAEDAAGDLIDSVHAAAVSAGIRTVLTGTRVRLGVLAGERRPTSALGVVNHGGGDALMGFLLDAPIKWDLDLLIWFHPSRFKHLEGGYKKATLRVGMRRPVSLVLGVVDASTSKVRGRIGIEEIGWIRWGDVEGRADILRHEYPSSWEELAIEMAAVYPLLDRDTWLTYYRFEYDSM